MSQAANPTCEDSLDERLNGAQREAVTHQQGPLLILAGAGSGKTHVLTSRIAFLVRHRGVALSAILAVTFTNKAAREMRERVGRTLGNDAAGLWVCTFHSACLRILRSTGTVGNIPRNFAVVDAGESVSMIREIQKTLGISTELYAPKAVASRISALKNRMIRPSDIAEQEHGFGLDQKVAIVYRQYQERLRSVAALDFDDLLCETVDLLVKRPDVLEAYRNRFHYVLVDEYQDTNAAQYRLIRLLGDGRRNVCVVGDDDQSIYRFRGADVSNILNFRKDYPDAAVVLLEENYRSTQAILTAAGGVVSENRKRTPKTLWTRRGAGEKVIVIEASDETREADIIAQQIESMSRDGGRAHEEFAILYRTNVQSRILEERLRIARVPYRIIGATGFYERREIKDILAYLRVLNNPLDAGALRRILNTPPRGIGSALVSRLDQAVKRGTPLWQALDTEAANHKEADALVTLLRSLMQDAPKLSMSGVVQVLLDRTGYRDFLAKRTDDLADRLENIDEFLGMAGSFDARHEGRGVIEDFLDEILLMTDTERKDTGGAVSLLTLHSAKGLEFPVVFMTGMEEGVLPHVQALTDPGEMEEERRLCYVGMTRAKDKLLLTRARKRRLMGTERWNNPSRFLDAIPADVTDSIRCGDIGGRRPLTSGESSSPCDSSEKDGGRQEGDFPVGKRVRHPKFGVGTIRSREGRGDDLRVSIYFSAAGMRKLSVKAAGLSAD